MSKMIRPLMVALMALVFAACSKEKSVDSTEDGGLGEFRMKVDGVQWTAAAGAAVITDGAILINGTSADLKMMYIQLDGTTSTTYQLNQGSNGYAAYLDQNEPAPTEYSTDQGQTADDAGGQVIVTKIDVTKKRISGTFSFRMYRDIDSKQIIITEGVFENLPYTDTLPDNWGGPDPGGPDPEDESWVMKVDGADWVASTINGTVDVDILELEGLDPSGDSRLTTIEVPKDILPGTYKPETDDIDMTYTIMFGPNPGDYLAETGELVITEHNTTTKTIKGTYHFVGKYDPGSGDPPKTANITNGSFTVVYD